MEFTPSVNETLSWLGRVRFLIITFLVAVVVALRQLTPITLPVRPLVLLIALWYALAAAYVLLHRWLPESRWHAPVQTVCDLLVVTGVVYWTGAEDSYFISLYLLSILMGSILFSRRGVFLVAGASFSLLGAIVELSYYAYIPRTASSIPNLRAAETWLGSNLFAFFAVAYLGSLLAQNLRKKGVELEEKSSELKDLQAFNEDIIDSMRGGLLTTDLDGQILLLNRAGAEITGHGFGLLRGEHVRDIRSPVFGPSKWTSRALRWHCARKWNSRRRRAPVRFLGLSISPLRTGQNQTTGYVFNFQDLTELKRLEREIVTKEHMAALGRLSAAIAHEIRQPLTAMTGALKELARLAPLEDDDKKLVQIVSRESQRLNQIITEFLDYSREKTYSFSDIEIVSLIEETLLLLERDSSARGKYQIERRFAARNIRARADRDRHEAGILESLQQRPARHAARRQCSQSASMRPRIGCAFRSATREWASIPRKAHEFSNRSNRVLQAARGSGSPSSTRFSKAIADAFASKVKKGTERNSSWSFRELFAAQADGACDRPERSRTCSYRGEEIASHGPLTGR